MIRLVHADARRTGMDAGSMHACITSPPYFGLRHYDAGKAEIGAEPTAEAYVTSLVEVGREVRRVLRDDGTWWLNLGDSYGNDTKWGGASGGKHPPELHGNGGEGFRMKRRTGVAPKNLLLIPARVALALQADGWIVRADAPWLKRNAMPSPQRDRPTLAHETIYLLSKGPRYFFDLEAVRRGFADERTAPGRSLRTSDFFFDSLDVIRRALDRLDDEGGMLVADNGPIAFDVPTSPSTLGHFAMWPPRLVAEMVRASTSEAGCCLACGAPWVRVVEKMPAVSTRTTVEITHARKVLHGPTYSRHKTAIKGGQSLMSSVSRTMGFVPSCACPAAPPVPCRVVDPFGGAGTTAAVADALGRDGYSLELNKAYRALAKPRIAEVRAALLREHKGAAMPELADFDDAAELEVA